MNSGQHHHSDTGELEKFSGDSLEALVDSTIPLPERYGDDRLVAMVRDPRCVFVYWEFTIGNSDRLRQEGGADIWENADFILRVQMDSSGFFDVEVPRHVLKWYIVFDQPGMACTIDLGLRRRDGVFFSLLRSNHIQLPAGRVSEMTDAQFAAVHVAGDGAPDHEVSELMRRDAERVGRGSAEFSKSMAQRWEFLRSVFSGSSPSSAPSSRSGSSLSPKP